MKIERSEAYGTLSRSRKSYVPRCFGGGHREADAARDDPLGDWHADPTVLMRVDAGAYDRVASDG